MANALRWRPVRVHSFREQAVIREFGLPAGEGVRSVWAKMSNGRAALRGLKFDRDAFDKQKISEWRGTHDEAEIAIASEVVGQCYVKLIERFEAMGGKLDRAASVLRDTKICGWESVNGRSYRAALAEAATMYEGVYSNLNHPGADGVLVESRFGQFKNVRLADDGLRGDLHYNPKHVYAEQMLWWAENNPNAIANSHRVNAIGHVDRATKKFIVEKIERVFAVELVADGGTNKGLHEGAQDDVEELTDGDINLEEHGDPRVSRCVARLMAKGFSESRAEAIATATLHESPEARDMGKSDNTTTLAEMDAADILAARPDLVEAAEARIASKGETKALKEKADALAVENKVLKEKVDGFEIKAKLEEKRAKAKKLCEDKKLPAIAITDVFVDSLVESKDDAAMAKLVDDRAALVESTRGGVKSKSKTLNEQAGKKDGDATPAEKPKDANEFVEQVFAEV